MATTTTTSAILFSGLGKFYFHNPAGKWELKDYELLFTASSWEDLWNSTRYIFGLDGSLRGDYFFMKDPYPPMYEKPLNQRGGAYQIKVNQSDAQETFETYMAAMMQNKIAKDPENKIVGVTICLKKEFHIIKLWNLDGKKYNRVEDIRILKPTPSVIYKVHIDRPM